MCQVLREDGGFTKASGTGTGWMSSNWHLDGYWDPDNDELRTAFGYRSVFAQFLTM